MSRVLRVVGSFGVAVLVMLTIGWTSGRTTSASQDEDVASTTALDAAVRIHPPRQTIGRP